MVRAGIAERFVKSVIDFNWINPRAENKSNTMVYVESKVKEIPTINTFFNVQKTMKEIKWLMLISACILSTRIRFSR